MAYYSVLVREQRKGVRRRRKLAVVASSIAQAHIYIMELCKGTGFIPDYTTVDEITDNCYRSIVSTLMGRSIQLPVQQ
jgi:hypothetical protein